MGRQLYHYKSQRKRERERDNYMWNFRPVYVSTSTHYTKFAKCIFIIRFSPAQMFMKLYTHTHTDVTATAEPKEWPLRCNNSRPTTIFSTSQQLLPIIHHLLLPCPQPVVQQNHIKSSVVSSPSHKHLHNLNSNYSYACNSWLPSTYFQSYHSNITSNPSSLQLVDCYIMVEEGNTGPLIKFNNIPSHLTI